MLQLPRLGCRRHRILKLDIISLSNIPLFPFCFGFLLVKQSGGLMIRFGSSVSESEIFLLRFGLVYTGKRKTLFFGHIGLPVTFLVTAVRAASSGFHQ